MSFKKTSDFLSVCRVNGRIHETNRYNQIEQAASVLHNLGEEFSTINMEALSATDKQSVMKRIDKAHKRIQDTLKADLLSAQGQYNLSVNAFVAASEPTDKDFQLAAMLSGKGPSQLIDIAHKSPSAARLLCGSDAGLMAGLTHKQMEALEQYAAPSEYEAIGKAKDILAVNESMTDLANNVSRGLAMQFTFQPEQDKLAKALSKTDEEMTDAVQDKEASEEPSISQQVKDYQSGKESRISQE